MLIMSPDIGALGILLQLLYDVIKYKYLQTITSSAYSGSATTTSSLTHVDMTTNIGILTSQVSLAKQF